VDRSFISPEAQDHRAVVILQSIIAMGHELGLAIVAEGIENQDQVDRLGELGCDFGQGFFIGKPLSAKQVNDALAGLPYAHTSGRTAITWLWERAIKDPPPEPALRRVTAKDVQRPEPEKKPARPYPRRRMEPDPVPKVEPTPLTAAILSTAEVVPADAEASASVPEGTAIVSEEVVEDLAEIPVDAAPDLPPGYPAEEPAPAVVLADPPPVRRRRKRQRQVSLLSDGEG
ncbi:MAG: EAL domain-containing protein, partial [Alphaproteobacteria bacterium]|nr:EAL domain-containing protein [Alphaproteobacteria bacterium]